MIERKENHLQKPTIAPGIDDQEELEQSVSEEEVKKGEFTSVTTFSYDEVDPS